jgi:glycosyltransferase involved in cell wall biosynthesis
VTWNHLGGGWDEERLVNIANTLPNQVSFKFWGSLKNSEVIDFYMKNTIDLFINVSSSEGIPVSMMEAQNCGIVIAGTNVGGVSEIVNDENGFLLSADPTLDEITFVFKNAYNNKREMEAKKINSWANWQCHYSAEKNYIEFINGVLLKT